MLENLSEQAKNLEISQAQIAERLGLSKQAVNNWWPELDRVPRKHIPTMESLGFRFPGRQYESIKSTAELKYTDPEISTDHVSAAWVLVAEAVRLAGGRTDLMPPKSLGRLLAIVAERIARVDGEAARAALLEEAKDLALGMVAASDRRGT